VADFAEMVKLTGEPNAEIHSYTLARKLSLLYAIIPETRTLKPEHWYMKP